MLFCAFLEHLLASRHIGTLAVFLEHREHNSKTRNRLSVEPQDMIAMLQDMIVEPQNMIVMLQNMIAEPQNMIVTGGRHAPT